MSLISISYAGNNRSMIHQLPVLIYHKNNSCALVGSPCFHLQAVNQEACSSVCSLEYHIFVQLLHGNTFIFLLSMCPPKEILIIQSLHKQWLEAENRKKNPKIFWKILAGSLTQYIKFHHGGRSDVTFPIILYDFKTNEQIYSASIFSSIHSRK